MQPQSYSFRAGTPYFDHGRERLGLVAQNVAEALPLAAIPTGNGLLQVDQMAVLTGAISAIKELDALVARQQKEIDTLRKHRKK